MKLDTSIQYLTQVSADKFELIKQELNITSIENLLHFYPIRYVDKTKLYKINELTDTQTEFQIVGKITSISEVGLGKAKRLVAELKDETGSMDLVWFKVPAWLKKNIKTNVPVVVHGKVALFGNRFSISHPDFNYDLNSVKQNLSFSPIYPSTEKLQKRKITHKFFQKLQQQAFSMVEKEIEENLSEEVISKNALTNRKNAIKWIHFPENLQQLELAQKRLKFEEVFFFQLSYGLKNIQRKSLNKGFVFEKVGENFNHFYQNILPFELTNAQKRVIKEVRADVAKPIQMNRLLQGDVGSGKTMVALLTMLLAKDNGFQSCLMAPTEVLAKQHFDSFQEYLAQTDLKMALLTGSSTTKERRIIHEELENGTLDILIGTHALIEPKVKFKNLGFAVIDEQHKFGVKQRSQLWKKNTLPPHILVMTATPIPRTLALTYYSDLDLSVIDELPKGRIPIQTFHKTDENRLAVFQFIKDEIERGRQAYIVYPLIEESAVLDHKNLMEGFESVERFFPKPKYQISIVHGKMKAADKEFEMQRFKDGKTQIMVSTTVIEVGVNVPNASMMVIESAEKFGLSQLHQLRGRVGRGAEKSYCILMTDKKLSQTAKKRMKTMVESTDGFKISEIDLEMRGPGTILGTQQSGSLDMKIADLVQDKPLFATIKPQIDTLLEEDKNLSLPKNEVIKAFFNLKYKHKINWSKIS